MKTCENCGFENEDQAKQCLNCLMDIQWAKTNFVNFSGTSDDTKRIGQEARNQYGLPADDVEIYNLITQQYLAKPAPSAPVEMEPPDEMEDMPLGQIYFSFNGRIGRKTYWLTGFLPILGFTILFGFIEGATPTYSSFSGVATLAARLLILWPCLALTVKRWHDRDKSGWWTLIGLIPIFGLIWALVENGFLAGTAGPNKYGPRSY